VSNALPDAGEAAVQIQSFAKKAGFDVQIKELPPAAYQAGLTDGTFQAYLERDYSIVMAPSYELLVWTGKGSPTNRAKWESQKFYDAVAAGIAISNPLSPEAGKAWNAAEQIMQQEKPWILITYIQPFFGMRKCVSGFEARSDNAINLSVLSRTC
jgi:peptide/nickel transport system substrate-binding protein